MLDFSATVKEKLKQVPMSSAGLAREMGYTPQYLSDLLSGERRWNEVTMSKACEALDMELVVVKCKVRPQKSAVAKGDISEKFILGQ